MTAQSTPGQEDNSIKVTTILSLKQSTDDLMSYKRQGSIKTWLPDLLDAAYGNGKTSLLTENEALKASLQTAFIALSHAGGNITVDAFRIEGLNDFQREKIRAAWISSRAAIAHAQEIK